MARSSDLQSLILQRHLRDCEITYNLLMVKYPTVLVYIVLREKKPSWLLRVWSDPCCNWQIVRYSIFIKGKGFLQTGSTHFLCEFAWTNTRCKRQPQLHFQPLDNHNKFSACNKLKLTLQKKTNDKENFFKKSKCGKQSG